MKKLLGFLLLCLSSHAPAQDYFTINAAGGVIILLTDIKCPFKDIDSDPTRSFLVAATDADLKVQIYGCGIKTRNTDSYNIRWQNGKTLDISIKDLRPVLKPNPKGGISV